MKLLNAVNPGSSLNEKRLMPMDLEEVCDKIDRIGFHQWLVEALIEAYEQARKGKRGTYDMHEFELNWWDNILNLAEALEERTYEPGASVAFIIFDPKVREIFAAPAKDRSAHHLAYNVSAGYVDQTFIDMSTSCRVGKGTLYGVRTAQEQMIQVTNNCTQRAYLVKLDLQGYFMSLPREKLCKKLIKMLDEQFAQYLDRPAARKLYALCRFLWTAVIMDDPVRKAHKRGKRANWDPSVIPATKTLFGQPDGFGIVIGNLTSQLASNIYLDKLDKFVTETLGYKYYGRYVDDFYIMVPEEGYEKLKLDIKVIEKFLRDELELTLHPKKKYMQSVYKGMEFLGVRIYPRCLHPSDRLQANFRRAVYDYEHGKSDGTGLISYFGHLRHLDANKFVKKVFREVGWDYAPYLESLEVLKRPMADLIREMAHKD